MKKTALILLLCLVFGGGCTTVTHYSRKVVVKKDGSGKIIEMTDTEEVDQPGRKELPLRYKYID